MSSNIQFNTWLSIKPVAFWHLTVGSCVPLRDTSPHHTWLSLWLLCEGSEGELVFYGEIRLTAIGTRINVRRGSSIWFQSFCVICLPPRCIIDISRPIVFSCYRCYVKGCAVLALICSFCPVFLRPSYCLEWKKSITLMNKTKKNFLSKCIRFMTY